VIRFEEHFNSRAGDEVSLIMSDGREAKGELLPASVGAIIHVRTWTISIERSKCRPDLETGLLPAERVAATAGSPPVITNGECNTPEWFRSVGR
jgi:hypothetical protein